MLAEAASDIPPATLPALNFLDGIAKGKLRGASYATAGYGSTGGLNHNDPALEVTDGQRRVGTPRFLNIQTNYVRFQENANAGNSGPCYLDSGGPTLLVDPATGSQTLIALTYGGSGLNPCKSIALQYRLDVQSSIDFIQGVIDGL